MYGQTMSSEKIHNSTEANGIRSLFVLFFKTDLIIHCKMLYLNHVRFGIVEEKKKFLK
jgi:hypothetical protein